MEDNLEDVNLEEEICLEGQEAVDEQGETTPTSPSERSSSLEEGLILTHLFSIETEEASTKDEEAERAAVKEVFAHMTLLRKSRTPEEEVGSTSLTRHSSKTSSL